MFRACSRARWARSACMLEISLKVLPLPAAEATLRFEHTAAEAIAAMNAWAGKPLPISATAWHDGRLHVRLSGAAAAVSAAIVTLGGERLDDASAQRYWLDIREQSAAFFTSAQTLWRLSLKPTTPPLDLPGAQLIEWNGRCAGSRPMRRQAPCARRRIQRRTCDALSRRRQVRRRFSSIAAGADGDRAQAEAHVRPRGNF